MNIRMIFIQPVLFSARQKTLVNEFSAIRDHRNMLEAQVRLVAKLVLGFDFLHHDNILDSNSEITVFVIARLI